MPSDGFSHFVASMTAPVASGWSGCRVGLAPTGKRRLFTAHTRPGHLAGWRANSNRLSIQNDSGLPQGPAEPSTGRLRMRQTACAQRSLAGMIGGGTWEGAPMFGMRRREVISLLGGAAVASSLWPLSLRAQQVQKSYRVDYLALAGDQDAVIVKQRLAELGYAEGKNLIFDFRSAEGHLERLPQIAVDFVKTNPDVIVAGFGTSTAKAAQAATASIPIVFTSVGDPIGSGIVKSLNRPGGNITGLHAQAAEIAGKRLQILEELSPGIRIVAALLEPDAPFTSVALPELKSAADARGSVSKSARCERPIDSRSASRPRPRPARRAS